MKVVTLFSHTVNQGNTMNLRDYQDLKSKVEQLQRRSDKLEGALEQKYETLKREYGCKSLEDARKQLEKEEQEIVRIEERCDSAIEEFQSKWGDKL